MTILPRFSRPFFCECHPPTASRYHPAMSIHYETLSPTSPYRDLFGVELPIDATDRQMWPRKMGHFIRAVPVAPDSPAPPTREVVAAQWGLVPHWVKSASDAKLRSPSWSMQNQKPSPPPVLFTMRGSKGSAASCRWQHFLKTIGAVAKPCPPAFHALTASRWALLACGQAGRGQRATPS